MSKPSTTVYLKDPSRVHFFSMPMPQQLMMSYHQHLNSWAMQMTTQLGRHLSLETPMVTLNLIPSCRIQCIKLANG